VKNISGDKATKFVAWLSCVKGFLPASMTLEEAAEIFLRRCNEEEVMKHEKKDA